MKLLAVKKSDKPDKKLMAIFCKCPGETKCPMDERQKVYFGAMKNGKPMDDYTLTKDKDQRERYRKRHAKEKDQEANTPGALAYWILWGDSTSRKENIKTFKEKYNV
tara:strand:+ start:139 stop:459 length:321 start_codon:yes stop_codon:yes gene_type:complete